MIDQGPSPLPHLPMSRWLGPVVGTVAGAACGLQVGWRAGGPLLWAGLAVGAGIGLFAGCLLLLADPPPREVTVWEERELGLPAGTLVQREGSVIGRAVFVLLLLLFWFPPTGVPLAILSLILNRGWTGWARAVNLLVSGLAILITGLMVFLVLIGKM